MVSGEAVEWGGAERREGGCPRGQWEFASAIRMRITATAARITKSRDRARRR